MAAKKIQKKPKAKKATRKRSPSKKSPSPLAGLDRDQREYLLNWLLARHPELQSEVQQRAAELLAGRQRDVEPWATPKLPTRIE